MGICVDTAQESPFTFLAIGLLVQYYILQFISVVRKKQPNELISEPDEYTVIFQTKPGMHLDSDGDKVYVAGIDTGSEAEIKNVMIGSAIIHFGDQSLNGLTPTESLSIYHEKWQNILPLSVTFKIPDQKMTAIEIEMANTNNPLNNDEPNQIDRTGITSNASPKENDKKSCKSKCIQFIANTLIIWQVVSFIITLYLDIRFFIEYLIDNPQSSGWNRYNCLAEVFVTSSNLKRAYYGFWLLSTVDIRFNIKNAYRKDGILSTISLFLYQVYIFSTIWFAMTHVIPAVFCYIWICVGMFCLKLCIGCCTQCMIVVIFEGIMSWCMIEKDNKRLSDCMSVFCCDYGDGKNKDVDDDDWGLLNDSKLKSVKHPLFAITLFLGATIIPTLAICYLYDGRGYIDALEIVLTERSMRKYIANLTAISASSPSNIFRFLSTVF
eukprot:145529_1